MKQIATFIKQLSSPVSFLLLSIISLPAVVAGFFFATYEEIPHASELAFIEYSSDKSVIGSVVPASCASGYEHAPNDCLPPAPTVSLTASVNPINPGSSSVLSWVTANTNICTGWGAGQPLSGSESVSPAVTTTYTLLCSGPGGTAPAASVTIVVNQPVVTLTASPTLIGPSGSSDLTWTSVGAISCTASASPSGGWSGGKTLSGSEPVSPAVTTTYTLECSGPSGTGYGYAAVTLPTGYIGTSECDILDGESSCDVVAVWGAYNFLGTPSVRQAGSQFTTAAAHPGTGLVRPVNPDTRLFELVDLGSSFVFPFMVNVGCLSTSVWAGGTCITLPDIDMSADPDVIRSGSRAELSIEIDANYDLTCTLNDGGAPEVINHLGALTPSVYPRFSRPLTSAQIVTINCVSPLYPVINGASEVRVNVVPTIQEI